MFSSILQQLYSVYLQYKRFRRKSGQCKPQKTFVQKRRSRKLGLNVERKVASGYSETSSKHAAGQDLIPEVYMWRMMVEGSLSCSTTVQMNFYTTNFMNFNPVD